MDVSLRENFPQWFDRSSRGEKREGYYLINFLTKNEQRRHEEKWKKQKTENEIRQLDKYWRELIYNICDKDPQKMREIVKLDVFDFFNYVDEKLK